MRNNSQRLQRLKYYRYIFDSSIKILSSVLCSSRALNVTFGERARARAREAGRKQIYAKATKSLFQ